jgi:ubiquinone/menaquinone biosynthesis C-methylase UbiE
MPRYDAEWIASMLSPERVRETDPFGLLRAAGLVGGMTVVDYGAGPGFFALPAAEIVGSSGRVIAVDVEPKMRDEIGRRASEMGAMHVEVVEKSSHLEDGVADLVIAALFLHDLSEDQRSATMAELRRLCSRAGRLLVVEWLPEGGLEGPSTENRFAAADLAELLRQHGFRAARPQRLGQRYYAFIATGY